MIRNQWYAVLPSKAVKKGGILSARRLGIDLAFFRTEDGIPGCVADQCTHRGAALSKGKVKGGCIKCPFHGLEFETDGRCRFIPANGISSKEDISRYNVRHYPVREANGILCIWYGDNDLAAGEPPFFGGYIDDTYAYSEIEDHWNSHYSRSIENQLDVVHLPFVHYNTIGKGNKTLVNGPKVIVEGISITTSANNAVDSGQKPKSAEECHINPTFVQFKFPNIWMNNISEKIKVMIYFAPVDNENTILYIRFYCKLSKIRIFNKIVAYFGKFGNRMIERQDKRVVETQIPGASALKSDEKLIPGDRPVVEYRRIREALKREAGQM
ncbi:MAG: aromatic ring-hydroxylating dioxygenase subunit alpha [Clostridia bacterium]|nr:aromatic ring-hydroxylating dioxygenase subunit alpha [Clostridia bacterium]